MSLAITHTQALSGVEAIPVSVEVHIANGLPAFSIVGLPEAAVRESKDRVRAAISNCGYEFPARRITVNLAPADLPKEGGRYDLPIAIGILCASQQLPIELISRYLLHGELALGGQLREVSGALSAALAAQQTSQQLIMPPQAASQAALVEPEQVYAAQHLLQVCRFFQGDAYQQQTELPDLHNNHLGGNLDDLYNGLQHPQPEPPQARPQALDIRDIKGQQRAKRALEIAAAGRHNLLMVGPPGSGKTMLASRLPGLLPPLSHQQALEAAALRSVSHQGFDITEFMQTPFRAPHHTASGVALVGGGSNPRPGEISLAHHGVLFLDELTEFKRSALDVLREPMETGVISISRAAHQAQFPARFQLVAAMNPCPQGYHCDGKLLCRCTPEQQLRHRSSISAPLLDRIDIHIEVPAVDYNTLQQSAADEMSSEQLRQRVQAAYLRQLERQGKANAALSASETEQFCQLSPQQLQLLNQAMDKLRLSARAYHRILRLARCIADLEDCADIETQHLSEAISYRSLDRLLV